MQVVENEVLVTIFTFCAFFVYIWPWTWYTSIIVKETTGND